MISSEILINALTPFFPALEASVASLVASFIAERKQDRFKEFVDYLNRELTDVKSDLRTNYVNTSDFLDLFEFTAKRITSERNETKRLQYQKIFLTGIIKEDSAYDDVEQCIRILETLLERDIVLLRLFADPANFIHPIGHSDKNVAVGYRVNTVSRLMQQMLPDWPPASIIESIKDLEFRGLLEPISGNFQTMTSGIDSNSLVNHLTLKGQRLAMYLRII